MSWHGEITNTVKEEEMQHIIDSLHERWNPVLCTGSLATGKALQLCVARAREGVKSVIPASAVTCPTRQRMMSICSRF